MTRGGPEGWCVCGEDRAPRQRPCRRGRRAGRTRERAGGAPVAALTPGGDGTCFAKKSAVFTPPARRQPKARRKLLLDGPHIHAYAFLQGAALEASREEAPARLENFTVHRYLLGMELLGSNPETGRGAAETGRRAATARHGLREVLQPGAPGDLTSRLSPRGSTRP